MTNANLSRPEPAGVVSEAVSPAGHRVTLMIECGAYPDVNDQYCIFCGQTLTTHSTIA